MTSQSIEQRMYDALDQTQLILSNGIAAECKGLNPLYDLVCRVLEDAQADGYSSI